MPTFLHAVWRFFVRTQATTDTQDSQPEGSRDVVIFFIGPTGSGKSTIINAIIGKEVASVGHGLATCTQQVEAYRYEVSQDSEGHHGQTVWLVDTPGFDDTAMNDSTRVFKGVVQWIADYPKQQVGTGSKTSSKTSPPRIAGFIYLQDISQKRVNNRQNIDFSRLQQFLGEVGSGSGDSYKNLFLVTYQWPPKPPSNEPVLSIPVDAKTTATPSRGMSASRSLAYQQAEDRENELRTKFWKDLLDKGAKLLRVEDSVPARTVVQEVLNAPASY